jgi:hypothetical protein
VARFLPLRRRRWPLTTEVEEQLVARSDGGARRGGIDPFRSQPGVLVGDLVLQPGDAVLQSGELLTFGRGVLPSRRLGFPRQRLKCSGVAQQRRDLLPDSLLDGRGIQSPAMTPGGIAVALRMTLRALVPALRSVARDALHAGAKGGLDQSTQQVRPTPS